MEEWILPEKLNEEEEDNPPCVINRVAPYSWAILCASSFLALLTFELWYLYVPTVEEAAAQPVKETVATAVKTVVPMARKHFLARRVATAGSAAALGFAVGIPSVPGILDNIVLGVVSGLGTYFAPCDC